MGLRSIYPTREFVSWGKALKAGRVPAVDAGKLRKIRSVMRWELVGTALVILYAALMAGGVEQLT